MSSNPFHPSETDSFPYQVSQTMQTEGNASRGLIAQRLQSHLSADYHLTLGSAGTPKFSSLRLSRNYNYVQVDDSTDSTNSIATGQGLLVGANSNQSSSDSTRTLKTSRGCWFRIFGSVEQVAAARFADAIEAVL